MTAKILCIEDEAEIRQIIVEELNDAGYETAEADSGKTGLAAILASQPDLVLCDMNMPEMDGNQLLQTLRADHPDFADMPFVFLTAQAGRDSILNSKKLGADDYLTKPIDFELLLVTLEARLGQVQRMEAKQEQQLVKLYKTVSGSTAAGAGEGPANAQAANVAARSAAPVDSETRDKLAGLSRTNNGRITAGRLQFIGLDAIRDELGSRWPAFADRVFDIAEKTISKRIAECDVFSRDENDNFVICFAQLDEAEASFKADHIAEEIRQKFLGAGETDIGGAPPSDGEPATKAAPDANSFAARAGHALTSDAHSIPLSTEQVQHTDSIFDLVMTQLDQAAALSRESQEETLREILESCLIRMASVELSNSNDTPFKLALFDERTQLKIDTLMTGQQSPDDLVAEIDILRLAQVAEKIYARPETSKVVVIVDLSFTTLIHRRNQDRIVKMLQSLREPVPSSIALMLSGIPEDVYPTRMTELANIIRPYCRLIMVELRRPNLEKIDLLSIRAPIVSCKFKNLSALLAKSPEKIRTLIKEIHDSKSRLLVRSIPDVEYKSLLTKLGADLFSAS